MGRKSNYPAEVRERAVRLVFEQQEQHESQWAAIASIASKMGCTPETLRRWVRQMERDEGKRPGLTTSERERLKDLEREVRGSALHSLIDQYAKEINRILSEREMQTIAERSGKAPDPFARTELFYKANELAAVVLKTVVGSMERLLGLREGTVDGGAQGLRADTARRPGSQGAAAGEVGRSQ